MRSVVVAVGLALAGCSGGADDTADDKSAAVQQDECAAEGTHEACATKTSVSGARSCDVGEHGYVWSACYPTTQCEPGQSQPCGGLYGGAAGCRVINGEWRFDLAGCNTPLVLAFDDEAITFTNPSGSFDLAGRDTFVATDWVSAATPWLVFDLDGNGRIDDGAELFGSMTRLADGQRAKNGFSALAALDADGDGWLTARDPAFGKLGLWRDSNQDRESAPGELSPIADLVVALSLAFTDVPRCVAGNCERERAEFVFRDRAGNERRGSIVDVYLADRPSSLR
jgi:hypothetical protein